MEYIKLIKIGFNNMENRTPMDTKELGIFFTSEDKTAHSKVCDYFNELKSVKVYLGYDGNVYPIFKTEKGEAT